jgi:hypothetical protein
MSIEEVVISFYTKDGEFKEAKIAELNSYIKEGYIIDTINCDHANDYDVEADLIIYLKRQPNTPH